jgi:hypothetical protein
MRMGRYLLWTLKELIADTGDKMLEDEIKTKKAFPKGRHAVGIGAV